MAVLPVALHNHVRGIILIMPQILQQCHWRELCYFSVDYHFTVHKKLGLLFGKNFAIMEQKKNYILHEGEI